MENVMAFIPFANTLKVTLKYTMHGKVVVTIYYARKPTVVLTTDLPAIATVFKDWWATYFAANFSSNLVMSAVDVLDLTEENGAFHNETISPGVAGGILIQALPSNVALVASHYTAKSGRNFRGRNYHPGIDEDSVSGNTVDPLILADIIADYGLLSTDVNTAGFNLVVASRIKDGVPRVTGISTVQTSHLVNSRVDTQRRRLTS